MSPRYQSGDKVHANGYDGVIVRHYSGNMYEVRLPGGVAAVDRSDIQSRCPDNEYGHFYRIHTPGAVWCTRCGEGKEPRP